MLRGLLAAERCKIGRRHVKTLMKRMGIEALYRRPRTTKPEPGHKIYPYLLRGMEIVRPNQVWAMDITYIPMARGSCKETSGISPSMYRTLRCRGADHRRSDSPAATANPMDRPNQDLPTPRGAYSVAKLRSGKIGESNISLAGISMFKKSFIPNALRDCLFGSETVSRIRLILRPGRKTRCKIFFRFCSMKRQVIFQPLAWKDTKPELPPTVRPALIESYILTAFLNRWFARLPR